LCPVGTSATLGSGEQSKQLLAEYARTVFGEVMDEDAIIEEKRLTVEEFFPVSDNDLASFIPRPAGIIEGRMGENENYSGYIRRQKKLWQIPESIDDVSLGKELKNLKITRDLLTLTVPGVISIRELIDRLASRNNEFRKLPEMDTDSGINIREEALNSLLALIAEAKMPGAKKFPFLYLQIQIWIRELSRLLREISDTPTFTWKDKIAGKGELKALPPWFCRECGASGWLGLKNDNGNKFQEDIPAVYDHFFTNHKNIYFVNTANEDHKPLDEYEPTDLLNNRYVDRIDLSIHDTGGHNRIRFIAVRKLHNSRARHVCPECNTENTVSVIGTRVATMSSITVSQILASDLDSRDEKYRKVLAFTNSVQDAAHQAGFIEARNYRFTFRSSLQKVLNEVNRPLSIIDLQKEFISYWKKMQDGSGKDDPESYYYRFFPSDYRGKTNLQRDFRDLKTHQFTKDFCDEFDIRVSWEIAAEFGFNAGIGRTLEKTGASAVFFPEERIKAIFQEIKPWLDSNNLAMIQESEFHSFISGMLHRIRIRGGIDHPYLVKYRTEGLKVWDLNWMRDNRHFLNKMYHPKARFPKMITTSHHSRGLLDTTNTQTANWFHSYFIKSFITVPTYAPILNDFFVKLFEILTIRGVLNEMAEGDTRNYCLAPSAIMVQNRVKHLGCSECSSVLSVAQSDSITSGARCLNYRCAGRYLPLQNQELNYYQLVYNRARAPRIYASEHTGLLSRSDREKVEIDFKERPRYNSLNALVATSTLEMGIDIGTLNTAINNSVPPLTSNYLQRIGRAGRSSGSALIMNFVQNKAHDLFYFGEPREMMEGDISTPGCFLEAKDILLRHFFASCLDSWSSANPKENSIPGRLIALRIFNTDISSSGFLISRIISYIKANEKALLSRFRSIYTNEVKPDVLNNIKTILEDESFYLRLRRVFEKLKEEYRNIDLKRKGIDTIIKDRHLGINDDERKELEAEKKALWGLKRLIDRRSVLEHLTNIGLLPNYAFPETGVTLNGWVKGSQAKGSAIPPTDNQVEIVRSAEVAIREMAPDNFFYTQGNKLTISGLNTYDWHDASVLLTKRFCSNCDHLADKPLVSESACPKCGHSSWASVTNEHKFVRLNSVKSVNIRDKSILDDSSEDRENSRYILSTHLRFDRNTFQGAWGMKNIPFGIEYVKSVEITEVNLGRMDVYNARKLSINQLEEIPASGFVTCRYCGKSTSAPKAQDIKFHYGYCKHKDHDYQDHPDEVFEEVFLFRNIKTEALKVLLPVQEFENDATINMFRSGLELGLKKYYKGNPEHIRMISYSEFNPNNNRFDRFLVLYDKIPGGTGYLGKIFSPEEFTQLIRFAYQSIRECSCQHQGMDGCYRCIFSYSNQYLQEELSRARAEKFFEKLVANAEAWEALRHGLSTLSGTGKIEESELEERFILSLRNEVLKKSEEGWQFNEFIEEGVLSYRLTVVRGEYQFSYIVRPQVTLGTAQGVRYQTVTDFYISCLSVQHAGFPVEDPLIRESVKDIAIYLDGYTYHATKENQRFLTDLQRRIAITESSDKTTWTLTWEDLELFDQEQKDTVAPDRGRFRKTIQAFQRTPLWTQYSDEFMGTTNSMGRLLWLLANPIDTKQKKFKIALFFALFQDTLARPSFTKEEAEEILAMTSPVDPDKEVKEKAKGDFYMLSQAIGESSLYDARILVRLSDLELKATIQLKTIPDSSLDKDEWQHIWRIYNLVQEYCDVKFSNVEADPDPSNQETETDDEVLKYFDPELHHIVKLLIRNNVSFNHEGSYFLENEKGLVAEAAIGFRDFRIVINPLSDSDWKAFEQNGYTVVEPGDFNLAMIGL
jgi:DEAD/DEAH box helicase domain-containing protein